MSRDGGGEREGAKFGLDERVGLERHVVEGDEMVRAGFATMKTIFLMIYLESEITQKIFCFLWKRPWHLLKIRIVQRTKIHRNRWRSSGMNFQTV
jgi:hypothetical protein